MGMFRIVIQVIPSSQTYKNSCDDRDDYLHNSVSYLFTYMYELLNLQVPNEPQVTLNKKKVLRGLFQLLLTNFRTANSVDQDKPQVASYTQFVITFLLYPMFALTEKKNLVGLERGALSLVSTN
jgi:hypothetical protein